MQRTDELYSLQRFIYGAYPGPFDKKVRVILQRPRGEWKRPLFKIESPVGPVSPASPQYAFDERLWVVTYFGTDQDNADKNGTIWLNKLRSDPNTKLRIPLWLFDMPYFPATLVAVTNPASTLPVGSYSVQIVAENDLGHLTKPSAVTSINLSSTGKAIQVNIPREPKGYSFGYKYHVYLGGNTTPSGMHRVGSVVQTSVNPVFNIIGDVPNGTVDGAAPALMSSLPTYSEFRFRYMAVLEDSIEANVMEDAEEDGLFNNVMKFQSRTVALREYPHAETIRHFGLTPTIIV